MARERAFGTGAYDIGSASHLLGIGERTLARWARPNAAGMPALIEPTLGWAYTFHDLLSLAIVGVLHQRGVSPAGVRRTHEFLKDDVGVARPLALQGVVDRLSTALGAVIDVDGVDVSHHGQMVMLGVVEKYLLPIDYGDDMLARIWRPQDRVQLDPLIQVGQPCVTNSRVTTEVLADRYAQGETVKLIAADLQVTVGDVRQAIKFETRLNSGHGLAQAA